jgi:hypothetical protein
MMNKKNILLLIIAIVSLAGAVFAIRWSKQVDQQLQNPEIFTAQTSSGEEEAQYLSSAFDKIFSGEDIASLYEGQTGDFNTSESIDE